MNIALQQVFDFLSQGKPCDKNLLLWFAVPCCSKGCGAVVTTPCRKSPYRSRATCSVVFVGSAA